MTQAPVLSFRQDVSLGEASADQVAIEVPAGQLTVNKVTPGLLAALQTLAAGGASEDDLSRLVFESDGAAGLGPLYYQLHRFARLCLLCYTVVANGRPLVTLVPMTRSFQVQLEDVEARARFRLSRFAYCRRDGEALVLESPLSEARMILPERTGVALIAQLTQPRAYPELAATASGLEETTARAFLSLLVSAGVVAEVAEDGTLPEDADPTLAQWEFHDLLFHARSRVGRHDYPSGGTFRFLGQIPPLPAVKPKMSNDVIPLHKPDMDRLEREDWPFTAVLERRRSVRDYGVQPINATQLGEFLYRVARVQSVIDADPAEGRPYAVSVRPYPSGGATYDLELYVTVNRCSDLASGIYHYDPLDHQLCKLAERNDRAEALLSYAQRCTGQPGEPQILITLASRFQRLSWKYSGMAYAATLKNVGVLYQSMYLVATAMGLAPCALGGGNASLFAEAVGTNYFAESSVGEFLLGTAPDAGPAP
jgi:SagB-type dehydrogenase family enzyme